MSSKLYSRVSNFDDLEPLTGGADEPFSDVRVSSTRAHRSGGRTGKHWLIGSLVVLVALLALAIALGIVVPIALGESQGASGRDKCALDPEERFNCLPGITEINQTFCSSLGCCWEVNIGSPSCFYSTTSGYSVSSLQTSTLGQTVRLVRETTHPSSPHGSDVSQLITDFSYETDTRLRIKVTDGNRARYEVPLSTPQPTMKAKHPQYTVKIEQEPVFGFTVSRNDTGAEIFKLAPGLVYANQFLQLSTYLPSHNVYGIGEHAERLRLDTNHTTYTLFASDIGTNPDDPSRNLYGVHPFYMCLETTGHAHGVFLLNSNAMDVYLSPKPSLTWRTIGGVIDLYIFTGSSPESVVQQFTEVIGRPLLPPYWALGFHLCRWGYDTANNTREVVRRMRELGIPQDVQWNDIDYMDRKLVFTYDRNKFKELPELVTELHQYGQKYIIIADPGISNTQKNYPPYDNGIHDNLFIKDSTGQPIVGKVWPNDTVYPDFTHPNVTNYWTDLIRDFHKIIAFDGLWIDMNEPSNFGAGSISGCHGNSTLDKPPFLPSSIASQGADGILTKTLCMSSTQNLSTHYNLHSLYGHTEAVVTRRSLDAVLNVRSLLISRSTYSGGGAHTGHWLGDNTSQWKHLKASIPGILDFALFGIPLVGADICGFFGNTTEELCTRWHQLGAFYPFSRNHNTYNANAQDPTVWSNDTINAIRDVLTLRYTLLPYLYTLFYWANVNGSTVARPLFFEYPLDNETWSLDTQFMWGKALLISPVLAPGEVTVSAYFPEGRWFDLRNGSEVKGGGHIVLDAPLSTIPLHVRGGTVIPTQTHALTTNHSRMNRFMLLVAMDMELKADGYLYLDDGESLEANDKYSLVKFTANKSGVCGRVLRDGYEPGVSVELVTVYGLPRTPSDVSVNNVTAMFNWSGDTKVLYIEANSTVTSPLSVQWTL